MNERIIAACDGAAKGNPGPAAWAYVVADSTGAPQRWEAGPLGHSTNNVGELTALQQLLAATDPDVPLEVRLDSTYTRDSVTKWLAGWKRNGWRTAAGKPVANRELIQRIDALLDGRDVTFVYVAAHQVNGDPLNAVADKAASDAARTQQAAAGTAADLPVPDPAASAPARRGRASSASPASTSTSASASASRSATRSATGSARTAASGSASGTAATGRRSSSGGPTLAARYPGTCPCSRPYAKGERITKVGSGWGHPECAAAHA